MRDVRVLHQEVVVADNRDIAALAAAMHCHALAKDVARADPHAARTAAIGEVLRLVADDHVGMKHVGLAQLDLAQDGDMADKTRARANPDRAVEQTERADLDARRKRDLGADHRAWMDPGRRLRVLLTGQFRSFFLRSSGCSRSSTAPPGTR